jgi:hypothetical protein
MLFLDKSSNCRGLSQEKGKNNEAKMRKVGQKMAHLPHTNGGRITLNGYAVRKECRKKARLPQM